MCDAHPHDPPSRQPASGPLAAIRCTLLLAALVALPVPAAPAAPEDAHHVAAAWVIDVAGTVSVTAADGGQREPAFPGRALSPGERVAVEGDGSAWLFLADGHLAEVQPGRPFGVGSEDERWIRLEAPDGTLPLLRVGLDRWGEWDPPPVAKPEPGKREVRALQEPLAPRQELVLETRPIFFWTGRGMPTRLRVRGEERTNYWSWLAEGSILRYPVQAAPLQPEGIYQWVLEERGTRRPVSRTVPFRVASAAALREAALLEAALEGVPASPTARNVLRCAYYGELGAWSRLLVAAEDLPVGGPFSTLTARARAACRNRMELTEEEATYLHALLVWRRLDT